MFYKLCSFQTYIRQGTARLEKILYNLKRNIQNQENTGKFLEILIQLMRLRITESKPNEMKGRLSILIVTFVFHRLNCKNNVTLETDFIWD